MTDAGLPKGWEQTTLGKIAAWSSGGTPKSGNGDFYGGDIPWAVIGDLNDGLLVETAGTITQDGLDNSSAKWVPKGSVLVAMYGASIGKLGLTGVPLTTNQAIAAARPSDKVTAKFLFYYLMSQREELVRAGKGAAQPNIGQGTLKAWPAIVPPLLEQERIVDLLEDHLSRLDSGVNYLDAAFRRTGSFQRSHHQAMLDSYGGELVRLADLVESIEAGRSLGSSAPPAALGEWGIIKVSAMTWGTFRPEENKMIPAEKANPQYEIKPGDLLVSRANTSAYVGASVLVGDTRPRLLLSDKSLRITPKDGVDAAWLHKVLQTPKSRQQISDLATGTKDSMRNISQKALLSITVPRLTAKQQDDMVARCQRAFEQAGSLEASISAGLKRANNLRRSLLTAAFSGRLTGAASDAGQVEEMAAVVDAEPETLGLGLSDAEKASAVNDGSMFAA
ncbi:restriction endonuclease subunit S [Streptomyces althioticus]|uniref:restriction endonuclease subunit S n=1 Tax=Streptomyces althioticus TaxID=83380 RepID=UPI0033D713B5